MTDRAVHICQSHLARRQANWYSHTYVWVWDMACLIVAKLELCTHMIELLVNRRIMGISLWQIQHRIFAIAIWQSKQTGQYWVLLSEYETWIHIFVAKPQLLLAYHWSSGKPLIHIPVSRKLRHGLGILGSTVAFAAGVFLAYDWRLCTTEIFNPVQNELLGYVSRQLWQAASHYVCIIPAQAHLESDKYCTEAHVLPVLSALCIF